MSKRRAPEAPRHLLGKSRCRRLPGAAWPHLAFGRRLEGILALPLAPLLDCLVPDFWATGLFWTPAPPFTCDAF